MMVPALESVPSVGAFQNAPPRIHMEVRRKADHGSAGPLTEINFLEVARDNHVCVNALI